MTAYSAENCGKPTRSKGFCNTHYQEWVRQGRGGEAITCTAENCAANSIRHLSFAVKREPFPAKSTSTLVGSSPQSRPGSPQGATALLLVASSKVKSGLPPQNPTPPPDVFLGPLVRSDLVWSRLSLV